MHDLPNKPICYFQNVKNMIRDIFEFQNKKEHVLGKFGCFSFILIFEIHDFSKEFIIVYGYSMYTFFLIQEIVTRATIMYITQPKKTFNISKVVKIKYI